MGISVKGAKITICGIAGLWLVNKLINAGGSIFQKLLDERKWHAYYKYGGDSQHIVPPGYASTIVPHEKYDVKFSSPEEQRNEEKEKADANKKPLDLSWIENSVNKVVNAYLKKKTCERNHYEEDKCVEVSEDNEEVRDNITELFKDDEEKDIQETTDGEDEGE